VKSDLLTRACWHLYDLGIAVVTWAILVPAGLASVALGRAAPGELGERLGRLHLPQRRGPRLVVHAVSVGEVSAAGALVAALATERPGWTFLLTTGNRQGRRAAGDLRERSAVIEGVAALPWDRRRAMRRWLGRISPVGVVVVETEIWPNLFRACSDLDIPLAIVNGRLVPRDVARYRLARRFFTAVLAVPRWIGAQSEREREAFVAIGAHRERIGVTGNLKLDAVSSGPPLPMAWRDRLAGPVRPRLLVAGSTHHPEERLLLRAFTELRRDHPGLRLVLAPRRPRRAARVRRLTASSALVSATWSRPEEAPEGWDVLVVDEIGPLRALFALAEIAFVGGSLADRGGHNPLEPAALGKPIVMGPSSGNFREIVDGLRRSGGLCSLSTTADPGEALRCTLARLLDDAEERNALGERAAAFCDLGRGVAVRTARTLLARVWGAPGADRP